MRYNRQRWLRVASPWVSPAALISAKNSCSVVRSDVDMPDIRQLRGLLKFAHFRADRIMRNMRINLCCLNVLSLDHSAGPAKPSTAPEKGH